MHDATEGAAVPFEGNPLGMLLGGSGLGLVVSRSLCEMMGGRLEMQSTLGHGTTVDITLMLKVLDPVPLREVIPPTHRQNDVVQSARILIADDNSLNRQMLRAQLRFSGAITGFDRIERFA